MSSGPRVVVIGGGVIGCAVAWRLACRGATVVLLERDQPGAHASTTAAGMLSPLKEAGEPGPFLDLGLRSLERYPGFVAALESGSGVDVAYRRDGRLDVALDDDGAEGLRSQQRLQEEAGYDSRILEPAEMRRLEPHVAPDARLGLATEHDHQVDTQRLLSALWVAAEAEGVEVRTGVAVRGVAMAGGRTTGALLQDGSMVAGDFVVVSAGAWSGQLELPRPLPIRPVRGQIVVLHHVPTLLGRTTWGAGCYLVPRRDGRILVGSTMEEADFRATVTAGAAQRLMQSALRLLPALEGATVEGFQVGFRPASPDGLPVIGPAPETEGLIYATGHFRNGILLAPETAELVADLVLDGKEAEPALLPRRLVDGGEAAGAGDQAVDPDRD